MDKCNATFDLALLKLWLGAHPELFNQRQRNLLAQIDTMHEPSLDTDNQSNPRAFCFAMQGSPIIRCSNAIKSLPRRARVGVLLHETGHILLNAFGDDSTEVDVDSWCKFDLSASGYHYENVEYTSPWTGQLVVAKALEVVTGDFLQALDTNVLI